MHKSFLPQLPLALVPLQLGCSLASEVVAFMQVPVTSYNVALMPDGVPYLTFPSPIDSPNLWVCGHVDAAPEALQRLFVLSAALKARCPGRLHIILTYNAYGRDEALATSLISLLRSMGFNTIVCVEPHTKMSSGVGGYYALSLETLISTELNHLEPSAPRVLIAPDEGASAQVSRLAKALNLPFLPLHKTRLSPQDVTIRAPNRDVAGKMCLVADDMVSTGGTLMQTLSVLEKAGAQGAHVLAVHGVFAGGAFDKLIQNPFVKSLRVTNSLPQLYSHEKFQVMNIASVLARFIGDFRP